MVMYRVLELFAGIGGMHRATELLQANWDVHFEVVAAVDVNTTANTIYRHNHPKAQHWQRNITGITSNQINKLSPDMILMSPPCQPHTRQGTRKDTKDPRSDALKHILTLIPQIQSLKYVLLENVQGFEISKSRDELLAVLQSIGFTYQEFLINPTQIGVPNSRLRYYAVAKRKDFQWSRQCEGLQKDFSVLEESLVTLGPSIQTGALSSFLDDNPTDAFLLEDKILTKYGKILDIVNRDSTQSCCFTKSYGQYYEGTGSVLHQSADLDAAYALAELATKTGDSTTDDSISAALRPLRLRFFSPAEIARLLAFPPTFSFPVEISVKQRYKTLGNSLNVGVVAILIHHLLSTH